MKYEKYEDVNVSLDSLEFEFMSVGPKGEIKKIIQLFPMEVPEVYNLAFGNSNHDGTLDDLTVNDNKDRNKILATVVHAVSVFCRRYPDKLVFFTGSTPERTRLYRMAISLNLEELATEFEIFGILKNMDSFENVPFEKGGAYWGFLIKKLV